MGIAGKISEMKPSVRRVFLAIAETALIKGETSLALNLEGLRLKALIREQDKKKLEEYLIALLEMGYLDNCNIEEGIANVVLTNAMDLPDFETSQIESIEENVIKRAILFRLFEESKKSAYLMTAQVTLTKLDEYLQVKSSEDIARNASYLKDMGLLESPYMDGGTWISYITTQGVEVSKTPDRLLSAFPTLSIETVEKKGTEGVERPSTADPRKVFVVHGRNEMARVAMFMFLRAIGLEPIEWSEAIRLTEKATPYIGEVLDAAFSHAQAIVVLLMGDDLARLGNRFTAEDEKDETLTPQARPNVIFESGLAFGRNPDRTVLVQLGDTRVISDLAGRHIIRMDDSVKKRQEFASRLSSAGCSVQIEHRTDWHNVGEFNKAIVNPDNIEELQEIDIKNAKGDAIEHDALLIQLGELRSEGVRLRNEARHRIKNEQQLEEWKQREKSWRGNLVQVVQQISPVDASFIETINEFVNKEKQSLIPGLRHQRGLIQERLKRLEDFMSRLRQ